MKNFIKTLEKWNEVLENAGKIQIKYNKFKILMAVYNAHLGIQSLINELKDETKQSGE